VHLLRVACPLAIGSAQKGLLAKGEDAEGNRCIADAKFSGVVFDNIHNTVV
jgi:hypothetical protein